MMSLARVLVAISFGAILLGSAASVADPATTSDSAAPAPPTAPAGPTAATPPSTPSPPPKPVSEEDTASYQDGFSDGCASANLRYARQEHVKPNKDPKLYDNDQGYHDGWNHGYRQCEDKITPGGLSVPGNSVVM